MKTALQIILSSAVGLLLVAASSNPARGQEVSIPDSGLNAAIREALQKLGEPLTEQDMLSLTNLDARGRNVRSIAGLEAARNLISLNLSRNLLTNFALPTGMTNLVELDLCFNQLANFDLHPDLRDLTRLDLDFNRLSRLHFPPNLTSLSFLRLRANLFTNFNLPAELSALTLLDLSTNQLTSITLPAGHKHLSILALSGNKLTNFTLPAGLTNLLVLILAENQLTNVALPFDLTHLRALDLSSNQLTRFTAPAGLTNLFGLFLTGNQLTTLTLPPDMTQLGALGYFGNPLSTLVLPALLASTTLAPELPSLRNLGVSVFTYPLTIELLRPRQLAGAFRFGITGPPGVYTILASGDLAAWSVLGAITNALGVINFTDTDDELASRKFYRASLPGPPANMVFIPPNTFTMGSPTNEQDRNIFEGPQTTVTLTRGFWIGKYEVTQGEYLAVTGENPSNFRGDLSRPVSSVTWFDATNYCWKLTQRELATGRIPAGYQYRLPTEAEWECAARAGTSTRFSYGDDPSYASLTNYAWFLDFALLDLTVHPVGQKLPNSWGLYDMHGHVWEWCQDWYDDQPGGIQTDPTGPPGPVQFGRKVIRGGAYDYGNSDCRSASRFFRPATDPDSDLGFRVVLVEGPQ